MYSRVQKLPRVRGGSYTGVTSRDQVDPGSLPNRLRRWGLFAAVPVLTLAGWLGWSCSSPAERWCRQTPVEQSPHAQGSPDSNADGGDDRNRFETLEWYVLSWSNEYRNRLRGHEQFRPARRPIILQDRQVLCITIISPL